MELSGACLVASARCICNEHLCAPLERHAVRNDDGVNDHDT